MKVFHLVRYSVSGIKSIEDPIELSFYKKTYRKPLDTQNYNIKAIYGINGSGKSAIITSVQILKNIILFSDYLSNPLVQRNLDALVNKKTRCLQLEADYLVIAQDKNRLFRYSIQINQNDENIFFISKEKLAAKKPNSTSEFTTIYEVTDGVLINVEYDHDNRLEETVKERTSNLLSSASFCSVFYSKIIKNSKFEQEIKSAKLSYYVGLLSLFGNSIFVCMEEKDLHTGYFIEDSLWGEDRLSQSNFNELLDHAYNIQKAQLRTLDSNNIVVPTKRFLTFKKEIHRLQNFIQIFKSDLERIDIERKIDVDVLICSLNMVYQDYSINAEFESTGIKKLIRLFSYLVRMVRGGIVFIDEMDSNLHDVYLCALLEYLMEYGYGQLCFTTHNVGPMDVLKRNKKSIDFLSEDHRIYSWKKNGNYSPAKLYRSGMIYGSPFNIEDIDFIGVLDFDGEENK
ncbi:AAA family ATPase [Eubacterium pyruvativorans]|uniref:AAA family ATPase n=1 Tax=Eubacterium pyruvativorans TaxID=155865 RepID=UPI00087FAF4B|nr:AAA family ATPase [Eubacterium pyruvativorans]SDF72190.1 AAA domain-containing protein, putative AbiEii toxin, Type IV TA system [Eubacterium pyruvativorans]